MFCQQMIDFSVPFAFENIAITKICYEERAFDHLYLVLADDIFLREILQTESAYYILKVFEVNSKMFVKKQ